MAQQSKALAVLGEDPSFVLSTYSMQLTTAYTSRRSDVFSGHSTHLHTYGVLSYTQLHTYTHEVNNTFFYRKKMKKVSFQSQEG